MMVSCRLSYVLIIELNFNFSAQHFSALRGAEFQLLEVLKDCDDLPECKQVQRDYEIGLLDEMQIDYDKVRENGCFYDAKQTTKNLTP